MTLMVFLVVTPCSLLHFSCPPPSASCSQGVTGDLQLLQVSIASSSDDAGWHITNVTSGGGSSNSSSTTIPAAAPQPPSTTQPQRSLPCSVTLAPGELRSCFFRLFSPGAAGKAVAALGAAPGGSSGRGAVNDGHTALGQQQQPQQQAGMLLPIAQGPLKYFSRQALLQQQQQQHQANLRSTVPHAAFVSDAPADVLLLWQLQPSRPGQAAAEQQQQQQQQQQEQQVAPRIGLLAFHDLCGAARLNPLRVALSGPGLSVTLTHDFRSSPLCLARLSLRVRNCGITPLLAELHTAEAGGGSGCDMERHAHRHSWIASAAPPGSRHAQQALLAAPFAPAAAAGGGGIGGSGGTAPASPVTPVDTTVPSTSATATHEEEVLAGLPPGPTHMWLGPAVAPLPPLQPGSTAEVEVTVALQRPGLYILDDYAVHWRCSSSTGSQSSGATSGVKMGEATLLRVDASGAAGHGAGAAR